MTKMPTVVINPGATVFVTGVNGLIGSYIVDQLLVRGYNVRGAVRDIEKNALLAQYFEDKYKSAKLELVAVPDMTVSGCYDDLVEGVEGFIHVAAPVGTVVDLQLALDLGRKSGLNALEACAKMPSIKRFVATSSCVAASFAKPHLDHDVYLDKSAYNEEAMERAQKAEGRARNFLVYSAMKTESEKAMWNWMEEHKPGFAFNCILPNANFGPVLVPEHQGYPSTIDWARPAWTGEHLAAYVQAVDPQWFISVLDTALLHVAALLYSEVQGERLFGYAERWNQNQLLAIYRKNYPEREFPEDIEGLGHDRVKAPSERAEEVLKWIKGTGWDGLEESVVAMSKDW